MHTVKAITNIDFGATGEEAIFQNVAFIISTHKGSCPLDREFGSNPPVDTPMNTGPALHANQLIEAIHTFEPEARVIEIDFEGDPLQGIVEPKVMVTIDGESI